MAKKNAGHSRIWDCAPPAPARPVPPDLSILGSGLKYLGPVYWEPRMLFRGALDVRLRQVTGEFPATLRRDRKTHPLFVMDRIADLGFRVCPCSSRNRSARRFIRQGCILEITEQATDRDTYLVESFAFPMPQDPAFRESLRFMGRVPETCLAECGT